MDVQELLAREGIRDTLARYHLSGDRGRLGEMLDCFTADAVLEIDGESPARGRGAIETRLAGAVEGLHARVPAEETVLRHHLTTSGITLDGSDRARAWSYFAVVTDAGLDHAGRYVDELRLVDGHWRLSRRRVVVEWRSAQSRYGGPPRAADRGEAAP
jgi:hypothetical protein